MIRALPSIAAALMAVLVACLDPAAAAAPGAAAMPGATVDPAKADAPPQPDAPVSRAATIKTLREIAAREARLADLPVSLVDTVMQIESDYRADRIGDVGEIGLMQVRPATAAMMGFRGTSAELADPATNIHYGATYLGTAWRLAKGNVCRTLMKYRAGHGNESMTALSVTYCQRARAHLASIGSPLAATITPADLVAVAVASAHPGAGPKDPVPTDTRPGESLKVNGRPKTGQAFWTAFEARIRRINTGIEAKWRRRTASR